MGVRAAVVDTSVLHAYLVEEDPLHRAARLLLDQLELAVAPSIVVHELLWSLRRRLGWRTAGALVESIVSNPRIRVEPVGEGDVWFALGDPRRYHDLLVVSTALRLGLPLATLDRDMARLARRHGVELLAPKQATLQHHH